MLGTEAAEELSHELSSIVLDDGVGDAEASDDIFSDKFLHVFVLYGDQRFGRHPFCEVVGSGN